MDNETIKRINRDALRAAQEAEASSKSNGVDSRQLMVYLGAVAVAAVVYYLLRQYQPEFVKVKDNGVSKYDDKRSILAAIVAGLLVVLGNHLMRND